MVSFSNELYSENLKPLIYQVRSGALEEQARGFYVYPLILCVLCMIHFQIVACDKQITWRFNGLVLSQDFTNFMFDITI